MGSLAAAALTLGTLGGGLSSRYWARASRTHGGRVFSALLGARLWGGLGVVLLAGYVLAGLADGHRVEAALGAAGLLCGGWLTRLSGRLLPVAAAGTPAFSLAAREAMTASSVRMLRVGQIVLPLAALVLLGYRAVG